MQFIRTFKLAREILKKRDALSLFCQIDNEALAQYVLLWPKTAYTTEDEAHEAGWIQGYNFAKKKYEDIDK